ncbi:MAG: M20/M25/M40 family metallo-hydrolase [candidate division NC10 bacterium]|nr:M20/M25/M40 family metallo-hydrolase [candidate division NC10 bacterium]
MIRPDRLTEHLVELLRIPSTSRGEGAVAARLAKDLRALGATIAFDGAGEAVGGEVGNCIARLPGTVAGAPPLLLNAHMDNVPGGTGAVARDGGLLRSDGRGILGADDKAGCAAIVEALRAAVEGGLPRGDVEVVFTICEEMGLLGAHHLDLQGLRAKEALVLDGDLPGKVVTAAPSADRLEIRVHGQEAHAGVRPEEGISAIRVAAEAIAAMRLGRLDEESTANVGTIEGGSAVNVVPGLVRIRAEARSHDDGKLAAQVAHMRACFEEAAARHAVTVDGTRHEARVEVEVTRQYSRMAVPADARLLGLLREAGRRVGVEVRTHRTGGGLDANVFNARGVQAVAIGCGQRAIHTPEEHCVLADVAAAAALTLEVLRLNAGG